MKYIKTFEQFINESLINESSDFKVSDSIAKIYKDQKKKNDTAAKYNEHYNQLSKIKQ